MFIEVNKVSVVQKKVVDGSKVVNPLIKNNYNTIEETKIVKESIRLDEIKSFRPWNKTVEEEKNIEGPMTMIYLIGDKTKKSAEMKINESFDSFKKRTSTISAPENE